MTAAAVRMRLRDLLETRWFQQAIAGLIVINAIILGLETSASAQASVGPLLKTLDRLIVAIFVVEIALKIYAWRLEFFRSAWNLFDLLVIGLSIVPTTDTLSVLRAFRVLRVLRLMTVVPSLRRVVQGLLDAIPGMATTAGLLALAFYVFAVIATKLFGATFETWFGTLGASMYTLFQVMTLESWSMGIVRPVMEVHGWAWAFFVPFIVITSFAVLNLFVAIIVNAMSSEGVAESTAAAHADSERVLEELRSLRAEVQGLKAALDQTPGDRR